MTLLDRLGVVAPIVQAPMAGISTPEMAAAVSEAGALGSIAVGATDAAGARVMIDAVRARTGRAFNVNVFVHAQPVPDPAREAAWRQATAPLFAEFGAEPPAALRTIYRSFLDDDDMLAALLAAPPPVVSLHFGLPDGARLAALRDAGCALVSTATSVAEADAAHAAGMDAVVAQGYEAGGHRGMFDPDGPDEQLDTLTLTRRLAAWGKLPVVAAGGIMNGQGLRAALDAGAIAGQLGTAFVSCPESAADDAYRAALCGDGGHRTVMTRVISGRPARCLGNRFTAWGAAVPTADVPDYPRTYDAGKALHAAAKARGDSGYGAQWSGTGAPLSRTLPAATLVRTLLEEAGL